MSHPLHIKGANIRDGEDNQQRDLFVKGGRIVAEKPNNALEINLEGCTLFPGLINGHDHLELNHFPRTKFREVYDNAHQWGEDVNTRLNDEPFKTLRSYPIWDRLFIGGLKNLLCGATTVAHHGPQYREMYRKDFPVRVLKNYGWAHSLHFNTEAEIIKSYQSTPQDWLWFIHLAEGADDIAASEYRRLKALGCVGANTVIVHGVGMTEDDIDDAVKIVHGLVWCPSTNDYLLGVYHTELTELWDRAAKLFLGSDSRLTADGDLIDEANKATCTGKIEDGFSLAARNPQLLRTSAHYADLYVGATDASYRHLIPLIIQAGIPQIGDAEIMAKFPHVQTVACTLDGTEKRMNVNLARQAHRCKLKERGLEVDDLPSGKRFWFF